MNAKRGALLTAILATALLGAGCDRPNDTVARTDTGTTSPAPRNPAMTPPSTTPPASTAPERAAVAVDDTAITAKVKAALIAEPNLKSTPINVTTNAAVVTLTGTVSTAVEKAKAVQVAENVEGVKSVVDHLSAKS